MITVADIRAMIWEAAGQDTRRIEKAKRGIKLADPVLFWEAVLMNVQSQYKGKPKKPSVKLSDEAKARYRQAKYDYENKKFHPWCADGHFIEPDYPDAGTKKGIDDYICDFLKWNGHFVNPTNNRGLQVTDKNGDKRWVRSGANKGMQDLDCTLKHPEHPFGIPWKIETKTANDYQSKDQVKFEAKVKATAGVYSIVWSIDDFLKQYDRLMIRKTLF